MDDKQWNRAVRTPPAAQRLLLGQMVKATHRMHRCHAINGRHAYWVERLCKEPIVGIYVGYRLKQNGEIYRSSYDDGGYLKQTATVSVALVQVSERTNPVPVAWEGLEVVL